MPRRRLDAPYNLIARCHQMLGDLPGALSACSEGLRMDPDDAELHFRDRNPVSKSGVGPSFLPEKMNRHRITRAKR